MRFTLWPSLRATTGGYADLPPDQLRALVASPAVSARKEDLEGWSPAKFRDDRRGLANVEAVSCLVLDVDTGDHELAALRNIFGAAAGLVHSSWSHDPAAGARKWRVVLYLSRDVTAEEYALVWTHAANAAKVAGITLDQATKDASRFWFVPGRRSADAPYEWCDLTGEPVDVDAVLASSAALNASVLPGNMGPSHSDLSVCSSTDPAAEALGRAWPSRGRHEAQLALAGALRGEGWPAERALEFLCVVCAMAGDEDRPKREATIRHTYSRAPDAPTTGWTRLAQHVPALVVDAVRAKVGKDAGFAGLVAERLAAARADYRDPDTSIAAPIVAGPADPNAVELRFGARLEEPMPDLAYLVRELGLVAGAGAPHLVAGYGFSGKTFAMQAMLLSLAAGLPVWGAYAVARPLRVLHVDLEQGELTQRRYQRLARGVGVDMRSLGDRLAVAVMPRIKLAANEVRWVDLAIGRDLVVIDSLRAACGGSENDSEFRGALDVLGAISHATGCRFLVIHHAKKPGEDDTEARYSIRGSSAIYDAVDCAYVFGAAKSEPIRVEHVKARSHGDLEHDRALVLSDVPVGGDPKGGMRVSVVGVEVAAAAKATREKEERLAKASADGAIIRRLLTAHPGLNKGELQDLARSQEGWGKDRVNAAIIALGEDVAAVGVQRAKTLFLK